MKKDPRNCLHCLEELCRDMQKQAVLLHDTAKAVSPIAITNNKKASDSLLEGSDKTKLILIKQLSKAFITPIDREDILMSALLFHKLSSMLNDIFSQTTSQGLTSFGEVFVNISELLIKNCEVLNRLLDRLSLPYSENIVEKYIYETSAIKQKGRELHFDCVKKLFSDIRSPYALVVRQSIYEKIKECCDFSYDICDYLVCVIIKNT